MAAMTTSFASPPPYIIGYYPTDSYYAPLRCGPGSTRTIYWTNAGNYAACCTTDAAQAQSCWPGSACSGSYVLGMAGSYSCPSSYVCATGLLFKDKDASESAQFIDCALSNWEAYDIPYSMSSGNYVQYSTILAIQPTIIVQPPTPQTWLLNQVTIETAYPSGYSSASSIDSSTPTAAGGPPSKVWIVGPVLGSASLIGLVALILLCFWRRSHRLTFIMQTREPPKYVEERKPAHGVTGPSTDATLTPAIVYNATPPLAYEEKEVVGLAY